MDSHAYTMQSFRAQQDAGLRRRGTCGALALAFVLAAALAVVLAFLFVIPEGDLLLLLLLFLPFFLSFPSGESAVPSPNADIKAKAAVQTAAFALMKTTTLPSP